MENSFENLEEITDTLPIEKVKKPHGLKGKLATEYQKANLAKGRELRAANASARKLAEAKELLGGMLPREKQPPIAQPPIAQPPIAQKKKGKKQVIVIQSDSDSSEEDQIIIRRKRSKPKPVPAAPVMMALPDYSSSSDDEPPAAAAAVVAKPKIVFRRYGNSQA